MSTHDSQTDCTEPTTWKSTRGRGTFLLQRAAEDVSISGMLPSTAAIDAVLGGGATHHTPDSSDAKLLPEKLEEDLTMGQVFLARLHTPALLP